MTLYKTYENGTLEVYTRDDMAVIYKKEVDKTEWECFSDWLHDVTWSGIFIKVEIPEYIIAPIIKNAFIALHNYIG